LTMKSQLFATSWIPWMVEIIYFCSGKITMFGFVLNLGTPIFNGLGKLQYFTTPE
jgi:hypothetical protein